MVAIRSKAFYAADAALKHLRANMLHSTVCDGLEYLEGCGKCTYSPLSKILLTNIKPRTVARMCLYIALGDHVDKTPLDFPASTITCDGKLTIAWKDDSDLKEKRAVNCNARFCAYIMSMWCSYQPATSQGASGLPVKSCISSMSKVFKVQELVAKLSTLSSNIGDLAAVGGVCQGVTYGKDYCCCVFSLENSSTLSSVRSLPLVLDALSQSIRLHQYRRTPGYTINLRNAGVACDGTIVLSKRYVAVRDPISYMTSTCISVIRDWCSTRSYTSLSVSINEIECRLRNVTKMSEMNTCLRSYSCLLDNI